MTREQKIELLEKIKSGEMKAEDLKEREPYSFERIGETDTYKDKFSGVIMTLTEIDALPVFPDDIPRIHFVGAGESIPSSILIMRKPLPLFRKANYLM